MTVNRKYEVKTHTVTEKVCVEEQRVCDICGVEMELKSRHWVLTTSHSDWGNDSIDSYEHFDVCSEDCLRKKFDEYVKESNNPHNTMRFAVERTF